jgi:hypothetical protein
VELNNIILSEVDQVQKAKDNIFSLICGIYTQYKYKQYYIYVEIYTDLISKSGSDSGKQGRRKINSK